MMAKPFSLRFFMQAVSLVMVASNRRICEHERLDMVSTLFDSYDFDSSPRADDMRALLVRIIAQAPAVCEHCQRESSEEKAAADVH